MGKIYQHIYSNLTLNEILHWHAAIALNNRKWKEDNHENENNKLKEQQDNYNKLKEQQGNYQGHPTSIFGKIFVPKTIWDLDFSEHLL